MSVNITTLVVLVCAGSAVHRWRGVEPEEPLEDRQRLGRSLLPEVVGAAFEHHEPGAGDEGGEPPSVLDAHGPAVTAVHHEGRSLDPARLLLHVEVVERRVEPDQRVRSDAPAQAIDPPVVRAAGLGVGHVADGGEDGVGLTMREAQERHELLPPVRRGEVVALGEGAVEHQVAHPVRVPGGVGHCRRTSPARSPEHGGADPLCIHHGLEVGDEGVQVHRTRQLPLRQAVPAAVVADHPSTPREPPKKVANEGSARLCSRCVIQPRANTSGGPSPSDVWAIRTPSRVVAN
jgi:hypothetical protein